MRRMGVVRAQGTSGPPPLVAMPAATALAARADVTR
jgi:hypothetical protein